ncbi:hypothetical protein PT974_00380 [Cladobotryum mycophilum]|uniref:Uncharacterized protein n=1 Tax=Cladobotryum mycophilum TaxID=491253 RepID=A0ABR0T217_9HYPO
MSYVAYETRVPALHPGYPPAIKPAVSHYQLKKPKPSSSHPRPFDPEELTRRLYVVQAEQKAFAERKRRARAAVEAERESRQAAHARAQRAQQHHLPRGRPPEPAEKPRREPPSKPSPGASEDESPTSYRHVPQVAASQFARTTTVESPTDKHLVHKLSRQALKFHMESPNTMAATSAGTSPFEQTKALKRAQSFRERQYERNQFQHTQTLAATAEVDENLLSRSLPRNTFQDYFKPKGLEQDEGRNVRRKSTGDMLNKIAAALEPPVDLMPGHSPIDTQPTLDHCEVVVNPDEHRVDWTQSDEIVNQPKPAATHHHLRKAESKWALKTRLGSFSKHKGDKLASPIEEKEKESSPVVESPKSPTKLGFFARFRR